jgi:CO/xanthine dehydrogenase Mo-binding subunit
MSTVARISRRDFLAATGVASTGLVFGAVIPIRSAQAADATESPAPKLVPSVFLEVSADGKATVWVSRSEMGQGVRTSLPMIVADELELPWQQVRIRQALGANDGRYGSQLTGGSLSIRTLYDPLRRAGAVAREVLIAAAAEAWGVDASSCTAHAGTVVHTPSGRTMVYAELVNAASEAIVPDADSVQLKDPENFRLIGRSLSRIDQQDYLHGRATFGIDVREPRHRYAAIARCPYYMGKLAGYDDSTTREMPGVIDVVVYDGRDGGFYVAPGVAVIATDTWTALQGIEALTIEWDPGPYADASTDALRTQFSELAAADGQVLRNDGDFEKAFENADTRVEAQYEIPFLAHATMEPMNCTVHVTEDTCEIWTPTQNPQAVQRIVADYLGMAEDQVQVNVTLIGGGFGRRLYPDVELEAATIARHVEGPLKVLWTREDDIRHDRYRPASRHILKGAIDGDGLPLAWRWRVLNTHTDRFDTDDFPAHCLPNYQVEYSHVPFILPRGAWRATVNSYNPFVAQGFLDEIAVVAGQDPLQYRLSVVSQSKRPRDGDVPYDNERMIRVIKRAAREADWGTKLPDGTGRGIAFHHGYGSYVAEVAEVVVQRRRPQVRRVVCVVDCGQVINPDLVEAQCEGAIAFALSAVLKQEITVANGRVQQQNFTDFPMLRIDEMPQIETHIIESTAAPGGMGEVPLPPLAPAVTNAIFDAVGVRIRKLPISEIKQDG